MEEKTRNSISQFEIDLFIFIKIYRSAKYLPQHGQTPAWPNYTKIYTLEK